MLKLKKSDRTFNLMGEIFLFLYPIEALKAITICSQVLTLAGSKTTNKIRH